MCSSHTKPQPASLILIFFMVSLDDVVGLRAQLHQVAPLHFLPRFLVAAMIAADVPCGQIVGGHSSPARRKPSRKCLRSSSSGTGSWIAASASVTPGRV